MTTTMSDPNKDSTGNDPSNRTGSKDDTPAVAKPKTPKEKERDEPMPQNVKETMLIKRPDEMDELDEQRIGSLSNDDGEIVIIGKGGDPLISEEVHKPGIDYLSDVAQDRRPLEGTRARTIKKEHEGEHTRIIDRSSQDAEIRSSRAKARKSADVHVGKPKTETAGQPAPEFLKEIAKKTKRAGRLTETVNLPRGKDAIKAIAKLAEEAKKAKKAIEVPKDESDESNNSDD